MLFCSEKQNCHSELYSGNTNSVMNYILKEITGKIIFVRCTTILKFSSTLIHAEDEEKLCPYAKIRLLEHLSNERVDNLCLHSNRRCVVFGLCCKMKQVVFYVAFACFS